MDGVFDLNVLQSQRSFAAKKRYCDSYLRCMGRGTGRIVYAVDDNKVLKLAFNQKGLAQNEVESNGMYLEHMYDIFAKIYNYADDYSWIEMQYARKATHQDFVKFTGYPFDVLCAWIDYNRERYMPNWKLCCHRVPPNLRKMFGTDEFYDKIEYGTLDSLAGYLGDHVLESTGDLQRMSSWGVVTDDDGDEKLVIIDYGMNDDVYDKFYNNKRK